MGCDIHCHAERRVGDSWERLSVDAFEHRDYSFFAWLAGVRNYSAVAPIAALRGMPADASQAARADFDAWAGDAHSESWVSIAELVAVDYGQPIEDRRTMVRVRPNSWNGGATCAQGQGAVESLRHFLGPAYFEALQRLLDAGAERVVFWFDN